MVTNEVWEPKEFLMERRAKSCGSVQKKKPEFSSLHFALCTVCEMWIDGHMASSKCPADLAVQFNLKTTTPYYQAKTPRWLPS